jgi:hypothetical protein
MGHIAIVAPAPSYEAALPQRPRKNREKTSTPGCPRGSTAARCARPAAWRVWGWEQRAVGRLRAVDYGDNLEILDAS